MKRINMGKYFTVFTGILLILICLNACEKTKYDLLDPESAGTWTLFNNDTGLPSNEIQDLALDSKDNLWVAFSENGVGRYKDGNWIFYTTTNSSILNNGVTFLEPASDGGMMIGTTNGISFRSASGVWSSYKDPAVTNMRINAIKITSEQNVWVGTENQGFYVDAGAGYSQILVSTFQNVNAIEEDSGGNVFLGTDNGLLKWDGKTWLLFTVLDGLPDNNITALYYDSKNRLWIGTNGGQTVTWLDISGTFHQLSLMNGDYGTFVRDIFEDRKGDIWFATWYDGLIRYDGVVPYSFKIYNGFVENDVNCIGEDGNGYMWFGLYSQGLVKYTLPLN